MKRYAQHFLIFAALALLTACATQSFNENLAASYSATTGALTSTRVLLDAKKIHSSDGQNVLDHTAVVKKGLDVARDLHKSDPKDAESKLASTKAILKELQNYLLLKEKK